MGSRNLITGISGLELSAAEREWIRAELPWGFILFTRNIDTPAQVSSLIRELREAVGVADARVLIDYDGTMAAAIARTATDGLSRADFTVFQPLADRAAAMTTHVVFSASDPAHRATTSATIINQVIRGVIGFQGLLMSGLLMSDDVSMNALAGTIAERTRAIVNAGCDMVLQGDGKRALKGDLARETPELTGAAWPRARRARASRHQPQPLGRPAAWAKPDALINRVGTA